MSVLIVPGRAPDDRRSERSALTDRSGERLRVFISNPLARVDKVLGVAPYQWFALVWQIDGYHDVTSQADRLDHESLTGDPERPVSPTSSPESSARRASAFLDLRFRRFEKRPGPLSHVLGGGDEVEPGDLERTLLPARTRR